MDGITLSLGGKEYTIPLPLNLDTGLRVADAIEAFADADRKIGAREPHAWRNLMNKRASAAAIISGCLLRSNPEVTIQFIRDKVGPMLADGSSNPEDAALMTATTSILRASGYFSDDDLKRSDENAKKMADEAAKQGEAQPAEAGQA